MVAVAEEVDEPRMTSALILSQPSSGAEEASGFQSVGDARFRNILYILDRI